MSIRLRSAATVAAAVIGTTLVPLGTAHAAPAAGEKPLRIELGSPVPSGPLTRGGATETFTFAVKNSSDKAVEFNPWMTGGSSGPSPITGTQLSVDVQAVNAPATEESLSSQDEAAVVSIYPKAGGKGSAFSVPASGELSWKVTIGLGANYPTNNPDLELMVSDLLGNAPVERDDTLVLKAAPAVVAGKLDIGFVKGGSPARPGSPLPISVQHTAKGEGVFDSALATTVRITGPASGPAPKLAVEIESAKGVWKKLEHVQGTTNTWKLPNIAKGFGGKERTHTTPLRVVVLDLNGVMKATSLDLAASTALTEGNTYPFADGRTRFEVAPASSTSTPPATPGTPGTGSTPSTPASTGTPTAEPSTSTPPATTTTGGGTGTGTDLNTTSANSSLASTGSSNTTWYAAGAALLIAAGGALAFGMRRRASRS
ncbi:LPXTG cell wall anchor domain-containing protein [Streptomyces sp. AM 4-1-1]|uniref:LPXTG cell wall anchor domain-containing protein n=1 Tax=Streptomyces sp. AM 4-1-1 TaxID=3028710 RepID=UPI0023BA2491|nr:LPXTG cell wall anchor domain-containing protein [Streptomyces sp. AM 4-1-1]WEH34940.1 LPXTG cell wall anchor domain-containing protein [Streptomyces sp. AM 4-1-1]